jgi:FADH2 O2-dependent halogenase
MAFDIAVVGSGFAGSLLAMIARRLGRSVVLLERTRHPRFAIGESSTPLTNLLLEELARRYELPAILPFTKWGPWQKARFNIACGLKRGFTFYHHAFGHAWSSDPARGTELLVAASPHDAIADTHWYRADFDQFFAQEAQRAGAVLWEQVALDTIEFAGDSALLSGRHEGNRFLVRARFIVDASGPRGFLHRALGLREGGFPTLPATEALYSHFSGVRRWDELHSSDAPPPYPVDDAAMHHVFDNGWIWVLRFNNGITSAGVAATVPLATELKFAEGGAAWSRLLARLPSVGEQLANAEPFLPFVHAPRLSFRSECAAGPGWALLPSAAGFVDPLLSTGFPLTLLGLDRLAKTLEEDWGSSRFHDRLNEYSTETLAELDATAALIGALYANMDHFARFTALTLLYFAAASYSETARRLRKAELARSFLLHNDARFGPGMRRCLQRAMCPERDRNQLIEAVREAIEPINVAGLCDPARHNWYPTLASDLLEAAPKLRVDRLEIEKLLLESGFVAGGTHASKHFDQRVCR